MTTAITFTHHVLLPVQPGFGFVDRQLSKDEHVLWYVTDGAARLRFESGAWQDISVHSCVWFAPQLRHSVETNGRQPFTAYSFRFQARLPLNEHKVQCNAASQLPFIDALYNECLLESEANTERLASLLCLISTNFDSSAATPLLSLSHQQRQQLAQYVQRHIQHKVMPADLAAHLGYSADYFSRLFKRSYGRSPKRWLMEQRIALAQFHLRDAQMPMRMVAELCGYDDQNIFSRQFKQLMGCSPSAYRRQA